MCNSVINRHGSFQEVNVHVKKDTFKGRVDFKNTLRQFNPKDDERSRLNNIFIDTGKIFSTKNELLTTYFTKKRLQYSRCYPHYVKHENKLKRAPVLLMIVEQVNELSSISFSEH